MKQCSKCKEEKCESEFYKRKAAKDGLTPHCKACQKVCDQKRYEANRESIREKQRRHYQENREWH